MGLSFLRMPTSQLAVEQWNTPPEVYLLLIINKCDRNLLISPSARPSAGSDCTPWARRRLRISQRFVPRALLVLRGSEAQPKFHSIYVAVRQFPPPAGLVPTYSKGPDKTAMSSLVTERNMVSGSGVRMDGRTDGSSP